MIIIITIFLKNIMRLTELRISFGVRLILQKVMLSVLDISLRMFQQINLNLALSTSWCNLGSLSKLQILMSLTMLK